MRTRQLRAKRTYGKALTIVIPTFKEEGSIRAVVLSLETAFFDAPYDVQILIINDEATDDATAEIVYQMQLEGRPWLSIHNRRGNYENPGLSGAMLLGLDIAIKTFDSQFVLFMDGDGQHPASAVRQMADQALSGESDIIVSTRYQGDGSAEGLGSPLRRLYSKIFGWLPRILFAGKLWGITDPLTGFFCVRTEVIRRGLLKSIGWKFGLEILLMSYAKEIVELQYHFEERIGGQSKANAKVAFQYLWQLASLFWRYYFGRK